MTNNELIAIAFGAFIGYWIVSKLIFKSKIKVESNIGDKDDNSYEQNKDKFESSNKDEEWYQVLKVDSNASLDEIHIAYKNLIRQYHPDKVASLGDELKILAEEKSKKINAAYQYAAKLRN